MPEHNCTDARERCCRAEICAPKKFLEFPDRSALADELSEAVRGLLTTDILARGQASLAVSGGTTPVELFRRLASLELPWRQVVITLVDERWLPVDHPASNEQLVRRHLLRDKAESALFVGMKNTAECAVKGEAACEQALNRVPRPFSALILGMGHDGHTASLFPGASVLHEATRLNSGRSCLAVMPPQAQHERMTLTLPAILDSRQIVLHIVGQEKKETLRRALAEGAAQDMPIRHVLRQRYCPVSTFWAP